jgi:hypothetical protein
MTFAQSVVFPATQRPRLRNLVLRLGPDAPALLHASRSALERAVAGLPVRFGTAASIKQALESLPSSPSALADLVAAVRTQRPAEVATTDGQERQS